MTPDEYENLLRCLDTALASIDGTLKRMSQQRDRTDATHAGISTTLARIGSTLEAQTAVMQRVATTLDRWMSEQGNGHEGRNA